MVQTAARLLPARLLVLGLKETSAVIDSVCADGSPDSTAKISHAFTDGGSMNSGTCCAAVSLMLPHLALQLRDSFSKLSLGSFRKLRVEALREAPDPVLLIFTLHRERDESRVRSSFRHQE